MIAHRSPKGNPCSARPLNSHPAYARSIEAAILPPQIPTGDTGPPKAEARLAATGTDRPRDTAKVAASAPASSKEERGQHQEMGLCHDWRLSVQGRANQYRSAHPNATVLYSKRRWRDYLKLSGIGSNRIGTVTLERSMYSTLDRPLQQSRVECEGQSKSIPIRTPQRNGFFEYGTKWLRLAEGCQVWVRTESGRLPSCASYTARGERSPQSRSRSEIAPFQDHSDIKCLPR